MRRCRKDSLENTSYLMFKPYEDSSCASPGYCPDNTNSHLAAQDIRSILSFRTSVQRLFTSLTVSYLSSKSASNPLFCFSMHFSPFLTLLIITASSPLLVLPAVSAMPNVANVDIYPGAKTDAIHQTAADASRSASLSPSTVAAPGHGHGRATDTDTNIAIDKNDIDARSSPAIRTMRKLLLKRNTNTDIPKPCDIGRCNQCLTECSPSPNGDAPSENGLSPRRICAMNCRKDPCRPCP